MSRPGTALRRTAAATTAALFCALALTSCAQAGGNASADAKAPAVRPAAQSPKPTATPPSAAELAARRHLADAKLNVRDGQSVGVGMPVSLTFPTPVPKGERADVERLLEVTTAPAVTGAWSWVKDRNLHQGQRLDYRPQDYWTPGTKVTVQAGPDLTRAFTVARSLVATVDVDAHEMTVVEAGRKNTVPVTTGAPGMETWNGVMVVSDKQHRVFMDSQTVGYGKSYADWYYYAVHLTTSGTYLHQNPGADSAAGRRNITHGCIGLATDGTAKRFYDRVIPGDVVKVVNSTDTVDPGNGYGDWNVDWKDWLKGSALATTAG
ncbi:L,D-transpeptidase [Streptomyces sp. NPDC001941]|uniref:L,D-transpeptidase n=1 Tax=Streptomyces sp. NPDC001941 TaxID=3154659 RepID=UPI00332A76BC